MLIGGQRKVARKQRFEWEGIRVTVCCFGWLLRLLVIHLSNKLLKY